MHSKVKLFIALALCPGSLKAKLINKTVDSILLSLNTSLITYVYASDSSNGELYSPTADEQEC